WNCGSSNVATRRNRFAGIPWVETPRLHSHLATRENSCPDAPPLHGCAPTASLRLSRNDAIQTAQTLGHPELSEGPSLRRPKSSRVGTRQLTRIRDPEER